MEESPQLVFRILDDQLCICSFPPGSPIPAWSMLEGFYSITETDDELSIVCAQSNVPPDIDAQRGWRALKMETRGDIPFIGVLTTICILLLQAGIPVLAISTFDTGYLLVKEEDLKGVMHALQNIGHGIAQ